MFHLVFICFRTVERHINQFLFQQHQNKQCQQFPLHSLMVKQNLLQIYENISIKCFKCSMWLQMLVGLRDLSVRKINREI